MATATKIIYFRRRLAKALFSLQKFWFLATVALSILFDKHCPITE